MRNLEEQLRAIVKATPWLTEVLWVVRRVGPRGAYVAAGAVRDTVWNALTGRPSEPPRADVDVVYWDPSESVEAAGSHQSALVHALPTLRWEVTNQAFIHLWYRTTSGAEVPPLQSVIEGLTTWPETATAVGVRLNGGDQLALIAPFGLDDLFDLVVRHNPARASAAVYAQRIREKHWARRWPELRILPSASR